MKINMRKRVVLNFETLIQGDIVTDKNYVYYLSTGEITPVIESRLEGPHPGYLEYDGEPIEILRLITKDDIFIAEEQTNLIEEKENHVCDYCNSNDDVVYGPDPYSEKIHGDTTEHWICGYCRQQSCWDI